MAASLKPNIRAVSGRSAVIDHCLRPDAAWMGTICEVS